MKTENYKGFTNHQTYLVSKEVLNGEGIKKELDAYSAELVVETLLAMNPELCLDYAMAYLKDVDYSQLADKVNKQLNFTADV
jgi:hypothetical protein